MKRQQIHRDVDTQTAGSTTEQGLVAIARDIAVTNIGLDSIVGQNITTVAFTTVLETSEREALVSTSVQAGCWGHFRAIDIHGPGQSTTLGGAVSVAAIGLVASN